MDKRAQASRSFREAGLSASQAAAESLRCLQCFDAPCAQKCAAGVPIPRLIRMIRSGNHAGAAEVVRAAHPFSRTCGEICPDEDLCQSACTRGKMDFPVRIRLLHKFATDHDDSAGGRKPAAAPEKSFRVAVVGGGPAGVSCARELALAGISVDLFERESFLGGILASQVQSFKLPEKVLGMDIGELSALNISVKKRKEILDIDELAPSYGALFIGAGACGEEPLGLPGEKLRGVMGSAEFLAALKKGRMKVPGRVVVIGGGNAALDCAVAAMALGAKRASVYYRRSFVEMPAWKREVERAMKAGVIFEVLSIPACFVGRKGGLYGVRFIRGELGRPGKDGRRIPVPVPGSAFTVRCEVAVLAAGRSVERGLLRQVMKRAGALAFEEESMRARENIFVGGDFAGRGTVVGAAGDGKRAAAAILKLLEAGRR